MSYRNLILVSVVVAASASGQVSKTESAIKLLRKSHPTVTWDSKSAVIADVNCDRKRDVIVLGSDQNEVLVGVVSGAHHQEQVLEFPINAGTQNGFCAAPTRISVSPLECESDEGALPGCKPVKGCSDFTVADDHCDGFNFYLDSDAKKLVWWRH